MKKKKKIPRKSQNYVYVYKEVRALNKKWKLIVLILPPNRLLLLCGLFVCLFVCFFAI